MTLWILHRTGLVAVLLAALCATLLAGPSVTRAGDDTLVDAPVVWFDHDDDHIEEPSEREPNVLWDGFNDSVVLPSYRLIDFNRWVRRIGTAFGGDHVLPAHNANALDEVPNSSWFTNRIGLFPMTPDEVAQGVGTGKGPSKEGKWTVVSAKTEGVTPGFNIIDANGDGFLIKFDPPGLLGATTTAGVVVGRLFHAAGYNVPDDATVTFRRDDLELGSDVKIKLKNGTKRPMVEADIDDILSRVDRLPNGEWFAISSRFLVGKPVGPFNYLGRRDDDPNDRIPHEDRRELRGMELFAAWVNHFDTKQSNSLDMYVTEGGRSYVKHYLIDFASTLGCGANGLVPRYGYEYTVDLPATFGRMVTLGFYESDWRKLQRPPGMDEVGYWVAEPFDPEEFKPLQPNSAFANRTGRDGYWAAKIITAFRDEHIDAAVSVAGYRHPHAAEYVGRILKHRRDIIGRRYFDEIAPLDFFRWEGDTFRFRDLGIERDIYPNNPRYRVRVAAAKPNRNARGWSAWMDLTATSLSLDDPALQETLQQAADEYPFLVFELQVQRYDDWSPRVRAYAARASQRVIAVER